MSDIDHAARARLDYVEQQLEALFPDRCVSFAKATAAGLPPAVFELARAGKTIAAIKEYRDATGAGLDEAKRAIDLIR